MQSKYSEPKEVCRICKKQTRNRILIIKQRVTDSDWLVETYHDQCYFDYMYGQGNILPQK